jgi:hypothetical protein
MPISHQRRVCAVPLWLVFPLPRSPPPILSCCLRCVTVASQEPPTRSSGSLVTQCGDQSSQPGGHQVGSCVSIALSPFIPRGTRPLGHACLLVLPRIASLSREKRRTPSSVPRNGTTSATKEQRNHQHENLEGLFLFVSFSPLLASRPRMKPRNRRGDMTKIARQERSGVSGG